MAPPTDIEAFFGPGGVLARSMPGWEYRPEQQRMALAVAGAIARNDVCLVEAGTGVGKTLAYLVPAILSGRKTVVATGTRTLMTQVMEKEIPFLQEVLGIPFSSALLKGRSNYLCLQRLETARDHPDLFQGIETTLRRRLQSWARTTETGDFVEWTDEPESLGVFSRLACHADGCPGRLCAHHARCFLFRARSRALEADVVVTNHHLFFADLTLAGGEEDTGVLLPADATLILDEAHGIEEVATEYLGRTVSSGSIGDLVRDAQVLAMSGDPDLALRVLEPSRLLAGLFQRLLIGLAPREGRFRVDDHPVPGEVLEAWHRLDGALEMLGFEAEALAMSLERPSGIKARALEVRMVLDEVLQGRSADRVRIAERRAAATGSLSALPLDVSEALQNRVFLQGRPVILTSATLTVDGSTTFLRRRLGIPEGALEEVLASPFDFASQALLYVPRDGPEPGDPRYRAFFNDQVERLLEATGGRAFVLFTSHQALRRSVEDLKDRLPWPLLVQGQAPREELIRRFRATRGACLFATGTFWEGVDVAGEALSTVVIDRLPFDVPEDPLLAARVEAVREQGDNPFRDYQLPLAVIRLRQGFGRLIRRRTDRGMVAVLDVRLRRQRYGKTFLRSLPPAPLMEDLEDVAAWCRRHLFPSGRRTGAAPAHRRSGASPEAQGNVAGEDATEPGR